MWRELEPYGEWLVRSRRAASTRRLRRYQLAAFAAAHPDPWAVTLDAVERWVGERGGEETQQSWLAAVRGFYRWAHMHGLAPDGWRDPTQDAAAPRVPDTRVRPCTPDAFWAAESAADADEALMLLLGAHMGLRCAEIASVHSRDRMDGGMLRVRGKGRKTRLIPLTPQLAKLLAARPPGWTFPGRKPGTHLQPGTVSEKLGALLPGGFTAHSLRHAFATMAYQQTRDIVAVQELLGHASPATTRRYIAALTAAVQLAAAGPAQRMPSRRAA
jgi:integrase